MSDLTRGIIIGLCTGIVVMWAGALIIAEPLAKKEVYHDFCTHINEISQRAIYEVVDEEWYWEIGDDIAGPFGSQRFLIQDLLDYAIRETWNLRFDCLYITTGTLNYTNAPPLYVDSLIPESYSEKPDNLDAGDITDEMLFTVVGDIDEGYIHADRLDEQIFTFDSGVIISDTFIPETYHVMDNLN
jgi:hypothetical protein